LALVAVIFLVASGCLDSPPTLLPPAVAGGPCEYVSDPWVKTLTMGVLTYYVSGPAGGMGGSDTYAIPIRESERPLRIRFVAEWDSSNPVYFDTIQVGFNLYDRSPISTEPKFEGPSPIAAEFEVLDLDLDPSPTIALRAPRNHTGPANVDVALMDQPIKVTLQQVFACRESRHA
jgi:hypothetical protein